VVYTAKGFANRRTGFNTTAIDVGVPQAETRPVCVIRTTVAQFVARVFRW